jgi:outer membrane lipoprotein SlyB
MPLAHRIASANCRSHRRAATIAGQLVSGGCALALSIIVAGCSQRTAGQSATADSTLARDLALANAETPATQPQLKDTAATAAAAPAAVKHEPASAPSRPAHHAAHTGPSAPAAASTPAAAAAPAPAPPPPPLVAPSGASVAVSIADTVTTANAHVGDAVRATVTTDVKDASGMVVIPAGSAVQGTVSTSSGPAHTPHLAIGFTSIVVRGVSYPVQGTIASLPLVQSRRTSRAAQAGEVGGGAVVGGLLGRAIGGKKSGGTLIGAVAGAAAGVAVADKTESHDAVLPKGASVTLQLTAPISVPQ